MKRNLKERIETIFWHYGTKNQLMKCAEESAEFQTELLKMMNGKGIRSKLCEELADLLITIEYVKLAFDIHEDEIEMDMLEKIIRQEYRMENEK